GERIADRTLRVVPAGHKEGARYLMESIDHSFGGFLRGQLLQSVIYSAGTVIVMTVAGLDFVLLAGLIAALAMAIPFFGPFIAIAPPIILAATQGPLSLVIGVGVALFILQQIVFNVVAPRVMSQAVGIHPLLVLLAILVGAKLAGIAGAIFGVPVAAVISAMAVFFYQRGRTEEIQEQEPAAVEEDRQAAPAARPGARLGLLWNQVYSRHERRRRHRETGGNVDSEHS
ncbi:MAG: AI-2E family transporter, partial [Chloroflexota bacterium]